MEATGRFELPNKGFADLRLNHLATSPQISCWQSMVPRRRLELLRTFAHGPLKTACLPIPPPRLIISFSNRTRILSILAGFCLDHYLVAKNCCQSNKAIMKLVCYMLFTIMIPPPSGNITSASEPDLRKFPGIFYEIL